MDVLIYLFGAAQFGWFLGQVFVRMVYPNQIDD